jgi:hypothetical protein
MWKLRRSPRPKPAVFPTCQLEASQLALPLRPAHGAQMRRPRLSGGGARLERALHTMPDAPCRILELADGESPQG